MKKFILTFLILSCFCVNAFAVSVDELFFEANKQYADGNYAKAIILYKSILSQGTQSGNLYYNLGNTYFKLGDRGKAVLNYERAKRIISHDEDLFANDLFARSLLDIQQPKDVSLWYEKAYIAIRDVFSAKVWFVFAAVVFLLLCIIIGISIFYAPFRKNAQKLSVCLGLLWIGCFGFFIQQNQLQVKQLWGIVIVPKAEVRYSPSYSGAVAFELTEGMRAQVLRKDGDWKQIRLNRTTSGWIEAEAVEEI
ncbi:MAG: SH3 domain-containing protein [Candidatus Omnitrophota bacterium]